MKILVTGGGGQLGRALARLAPPEHEVIALASSECDVTDARRVLTTMERHEPDIVIHAGAMTDVDGCEREPDQAYRVNACGTQNVAAAAQVSGAALVYVSTNYVFDGESPEPYHEFSRTNPISVYGHSKLAGEEAVRALCPRHYIVRTAMVYDETGRNFVNTMLRLAATQSSLSVVSDQSGNPTYAGDLAEAIYRLVANPTYGFYHLVNEGVATWYDWAREIFAASGIDVAVQPIPARAYVRAARPPRNGALANQTATALGIQLPTWQDGLTRCLTRRAANAGTS